MVVHESKACTCYRKVTVRAQWNDSGQFRLIQVTEPRKGIDGWKGKVYNPPAAGPKREYFCNVFNLIAHNVAGLATDQTKELNK